MTSPSEILEFWLTEIGKAGWWRVDDAVDEEIRRRFGALPDQARSGALDAWRADARGMLALVIVLDQFPRNLHRDSPRAFEYDADARAVAEAAIARGDDLAIDPPARMFFYLPYEHSEDLADQDRCIHLITERLPGDDNTLRHAHAHRDLIVRFGRFPHRNAALGRVNTPAEEAHLRDGGYQPGASDETDGEDQTT